MSQGWVQLQLGVSSLLGLPWPSSKEPFSFPEPVGTVAGQPVST